MALIAVNCLPFSPVASNFRAMSTKAEAILQQFKALPRAEQWDVYQAIARNVVPQDYGAPSDEELVSAAAQTFALLDQEEAGADPS